MRAYGYIRKSVIHDPDRVLSPEMQEAAIRRLAGANGDHDPVILADLDMSGRRRRDRRPAWDELLRAVEEGEASAVYAYSLSRFARSVSQLAEFFELCERKRVRVRVERDQIDTSTATGKLVTNVLASLAQFEADVASERVKDAFAAKRLKDPGWQGPGQPPYGDRPGEDAQAVLKAFREAGSFDGAARALNAAGLPCRVKGSVWSGSVVASVVRRASPDEILPAARRGAPAGRRRFRFSQLLVCGTCGHFMTGSTGRLGEVRYQCARSRTTPHARGWVSESKVLPVVAAEAARALVQIRRRQRGNVEDVTTLRALEQRRQRWIEQYAEGLIDKAERDRRLVDVDAASAKLSGVRWVLSFKLPPDVSTGEPDSINRYLRRLFVSAEVDMSEVARRGPSDWVPQIKFQWRDPSLRGTGDD